MSEADQTLDARGLNCPMPILKTRKALDVMNTGQILEVITTDPGAVKDINAFCAQTGNTLVSQQETSKEHIFVIRKE